MRTKTRARPRFSHARRRSVSATTGRLPSPNPVRSSGAEEEEEEGGIMDGGRSDMGIGSSDSSDVEIVNTCLTCNKAGKLLICCGTGCAICLHGECITCGPKFDEEGKFYCPYCWYKIHEAKARELKKMALLAKIALKCFMGSKPVDVGVGDDKVKQNGGETSGVGSKIGRPAMEERNYSVQFNRIGVDAEMESGIGEVEKDHQIGKSVKLPEAEGDCGMAATECEKISETCGYEVLDDNGGLEREKDDKQVANELNMGIVEDEEKEKEKEEPSGVNRVEETIIDDAPRRSAVMKSDAIQVSKGSQVREEEKEKAEEAGKPNKKGSPLENSTKPQAPAKKLTNLSFLHEKRKRMHWRPEEEEILKEGVVKFSSKMIKNVPWRKILEFGQHVFDRGRTPTDLKDKWRKIVAKESSAPNE